MTKKYTISGAFTLIELLIVVSIIAIVASVVFVSLDPLTRFRDSRDAKRWVDISAILSAIKIDQVDNGGVYMSNVANMAPGEVYMLIDGSPSSPNCVTANSYCDVPVTSGSSVADHCLDVSELVSQGYLGSVPVSPRGNYTWSKNITGYTLEKGSTGILTVRACESENAAEIKASR